VAALSVLLRLLAPFLPFVTEEVWSWWQDGSVHCSTWPTHAEVSTLLPEGSDARRESDQHIYQWATDLLFEVRKQRSEAKQHMKVPITLVTVTAAADALALMPQVEADLKSALRVQRFDCMVGEPRQVVVAGYDAAPAS